MKKTIWVVWHQYLRSYKWTFHTAYPSRKAARYCRAELMMSPSCSLSSGDHLLM
jgi:hypothetical protein